MASGEARTFRPAVPDICREILAEHIEHTVDLLLERSRVLAEAVAAGRTAVVGLSYRLADDSAQPVALRVDPDPSRVLVLSPAPIGGSGL
ncbi:hypothetical protein [Streptomyces sp. SP2-10]|uniref:hypothetical protein n=1 Tax=Streptomyces sp. SP2-10 TaxID=2873385 RepID=UPI0035AC2871